MGYERYTDVVACMNDCEKIAEKLPARPGKPWELLSGTPLESLWGSREVKMNEDVYNITGWGPDRSTPWGPLPQVILAIRKDISDAIEKEDKHDI